MGAREKLEPAFDLETRKASQSQRQKRGCRHHGYTAHHHRMKRRAPGPCAQPLHSAACSPASVQTALPSAGCYEFQWKEMEEFKKPTMVKRQTCLLMRSKC